MTNSERFITQHISILGDIKDIEAMLDLTIIKSDVYKIFVTLSSLMGKLQLHLAVEDEALYPRMIEQGNPQIITTVERFKSEMGGIATTFTNYMKKWNNPEKIKTNPNSFIIETRGLFYILKIRINKENQELFPLLDALK